MPSDCFRQLPRDQAKAHLDRRMERLRTGVLCLAADLARANGTTFERELALLEREIKEAVAKIKIRTPPAPHVAEQDQSIDRNGEEGA